MTGGTRASEFEARLLEAADATERMLDSLLTLALLPGETVRPPRFLEAMRYACLAFLLIVMYVNAFITTTYDMG